MVSPFFLNLRVITSTQLQTYDFPLRVVLRGSSTVPPPQKIFLILKNAGGKKHPNFITFRLSSHLLKQESES